MCKLICFFLCSRLNRIIRFTSLWQVHDFLNTCKLHLFGEWANSSQSFYAFCDGGTLSTVTAQAWWITPKYLCHTLPGGGKWYFEGGVKGSKRKKGKDREKWAFKREIRPYFRWGIRLMNNLNSLSLKSTECPTSTKINTSSRKKVIRVYKMITKRKIALIFFKIKFSYLIL